MTLTAKCLHYFNLKYLQLPIKIPLGIICDVGKTIPRLAETFYASRYKRCSNSCKIGEYVAALNTLFVVDSTANEKRSKQLSKTFDEKI